MKSELKQLLDDIAKQQDLTATDSLMERAFELAESQEERREAGVYLANAINKRKRHDVDVKNILGDVAEAVNLSYIAKRYFNKDRTWLYQRINQTAVNGKLAAFTQEELQRLSDSLAELSNKIHQISIQLTH